MQRSDLGRKVAPVDADVKAGLLEFFFNVDPAALDEGKKVSAEPGDLGKREAALGDVHGLSGEMGRGSIAFGWSGVAVGVLEPKLKLNGANGGVDLQRGVEVSVEVLGQSGEELRGPGPAEAPVIGEAVVDTERLACWKADEHSFEAHAIEVGVILHAAEAVLIGKLVLAEEDFVGAE